MEQKMTSGEQSSKALGGYKIVIGILVVVLAIVSAFYYNVHKQQQADYALMTEARDSLKTNLTQLVGEYETLETSNEQLKVSMEADRQRADSIIAKLQNERAFNYKKLKQYERETATLRAIMRGYVTQIDSLNNVNKQLLSENVTIKKQITNVEMRAEQAEERAKELDSRVRMGAQLVAQDIVIVSLKENGKLQKKISKADKLSINFTLAANKLAAAGSKEIIARVTAPDNYVLTTAALPTFKYGNEKLTYTASREVDYQNNSLPVSIFYTGEGFEKGTYKVELYNNGLLIGAAEMNME